MKKKSHRAPLRGWYPVTATERTTLGAMLTNAKRRVDRAKHDLAVANGVFRDARAILSPLKRLPHTKWVNVHNVRLVDDKIYVIRRCSVLNGRKTYGAPILQQWIRGWLPINDIYLLPGAGLDTVEVLVPAK